MYPNCETRKRRFICRDLKRMSFTFKRSIAAGDPSDKLSTHWFKARPISFQVKIAAIPFDI